MTFDVLTLLPVSNIQFGKPQRTTSNASQPVCMFVCQKTKEKRSFMKS